MIVTEFSKRRKHLCALLFDLPADELEVGEELSRKVRFDESGYLLLDIQTCMDEGVRIGKELTPAGLLRLVSLSDFNRAKSKALWFLGRRGYASGELYNKLKPDFGETASRSAVERMVELEVIKDADYADYMARQLIEIKKVSARDAVYQMLRKGIDKDIAQAAVDALEPDPLEQIRELLTTRYRNALSDEKGIRRTIAALARRGFSYGDIRSAMKDYTDDCYCEE